MKKQILIIALAIMSSALYCQLSFEHIYSESANICHLDSQGEIYYSMDVINKQCLIYKMDHSLYKSIPIPVPEGYYLEDIQYLSEHLFNNDDLVELVYIYSKYVPTETSYYFTYETKLINENGTVLLTVPGAGFTQVIETLADGTKFMVYEYNFSVIPYRTFTHVYSLPESPVKSAEYEVPAIGTGKVYPNPAGREAVIPLQLPEEFGTGLLELYGPNGVIIMSRPFSATAGHVTVPTHQLAPGTYFYQLHAGGIKSTPEKLVVQ
jgi:hypothetical protein